MWTEGCLHRPNFFMINTRWYPTYPQATVLSNLGDRVLSTDLRLVYSPGHSESLIWQIRNTIGCEQCPLNPGEELQFLVEGNPFTGASSCRVVFVCYCGEPNLVEAINHSNLGSFLAGQIGCYRRSGVNLNCLG